MYTSETSVIRPWFEGKPYLEGKGLDLGCGGDVICPNAEGFDMPVPYANTGTDFILHGGDARNLQRFPDCSYDFIYSSHLLEDFTNTSEILEEWTRVVKPGGYIALYLPDEEVYRKHCDETGHPYNTAHQIPMSIDWMRNAAKDLMLKEIESERHSTYSFVFIFQKLKTGMHSGDMGDVIYGIPTYRKLNIEGLILNPTPLYLTKMGVTECNLLKPLLESQGFKVRIEACSQCPTGVINLDAFRTTGQNLSDEHLMYAQAYAQGTSVEEEPFLKGTGNAYLFMERYTIIINRSLRYWNYTVDYRKVIGDFKDDPTVNLIFVGLKEEYLQFLHTFDFSEDEIRYKSTSDLKELADYIQGADLFIGNQSIAYAIAEGLGVKRMLEVCPWVPNTMLHEPPDNVTYLLDDHKYQSEVKPRAPAHDPTSSLLYCTGWVNNDDLVNRYFRWIKYYWGIKKSLGISDIAIVDDGSPTEWVFKLADRIKKEIPGLKLQLCPVDEHNPTGSLQYRFAENTIYWFRFKENLGRPAYTIVPGWWRSFSYGGILGGIYNFRRIIFIESDCYILTPDCAFFIASNFSRWASLYAYKKGYLEASIQVLGEPSNYEKLHEYFRRGRPFWYKNNLHDNVYAPEFVLQNKIHEINKSFKGDRYGDDMFDEVPMDADYICNVHDIEPTKAWQVNWKLKKATIDSLIANGYSRLTHLKEEYHQQLVESIYTQFGVKPLTRTEPVPDAVKLTEVFDGIPTREPYNDDGKDIGDYYGEMNFDGTNLTYTIGVLLHRLHREFLDKLMSDFSGFRQADGTYALYNRTVRFLEGQIKEWDDMDRRQQDTYLRDAEKLSLVLINKFVEGL
ncbi:class I SAM-dependent methyltransferase [Patescibacteria group bacterium]|nr:class I SAM-dependent methyltransferase [Patescibacteria group bacterium]